MSNRFLAHQQYLTQPNQIKINLATATTQDKHREAARLHDSGLSYREVAERMGVKRETAKQWVRRHRAQDRPRKLRVVRRVPRGRS